MGRYTVSFPKNQLRPTAVLLLALKLAEALRKPQQRADLRESHGRWACLSSAGITASLICSSPFKGCMWFHPFYDFLPVKVDLLKHIQAGFICAPLPCHPQMFMKAGKLILRLAKPRPCLLLWRKIKQSQRAEILDISTFPVDERHQSCVGERRERSK